MYPIKDSVIEDLERNFDRIKRMDLSPHERQVLDILIGE
jgi:hypothetical protein